VLLELPEKIEEIAYCALSPEQKQLYDQTFLLHKDALIHDLAAGGKPVPMMHVFALLTALKRICDHPCLITKDIPHYHQHASGKWELFVQLLEEVRASGQKLVVFSQYLENARHHSAVFDRAKKSDGQAYGAARAIASSLSTPSGKIQSVRCLWRHCKPSASVSILFLPLL